MPDRSGSENRNRLGLCIALGVAIGAGLGTALDNLAVGVGCGVAMGTALGLALSRNGDPGEADRRQGDNNGSGADET